MAVPISVKWTCMYESTLVRGSGWEDTILLMCYVPLVNTANPSVNTVNPSVNTVNPSVNTANASVNTGNPSHMVHK